jgi:hypothetical protein
MRKPCPFPQPRSISVDNNLGVANLEKSIDSPLISTPDPEPINLELWENLLDDTRRQKLLGDEAALLELDEFKWQDVTNYLTGSLGWSWDQVSAAVPEALQSRLDETKIRTISNEDPKAGWELLIKDGGSKRFGSTQFMRTIENVVIADPTLFMSKLNVLNAEDKQSAIEIALPQLANHTSVTVAYNFLLTQQPNPNTDQFRNCLKALITTALFQDGGEAEMESIVQALPDQSEVHATMSRYWNDARGQRANVDPFRFTTRP